VISQTKTDLKGHFKFSKIRPDAYYILFEKNNANLKAEVLTITDNFYNASLKTPIFKLIEDHVFKVQADSIRKYTDIVNSEFVLGQSLYKKTNLVAPNTHVNLYSDNNELFSQTTSNRFGYFAFKDLPVANYKINFPLNSSAIKAKLNYIPADYEIIINDSLAKGNKKLIVYGKLLGGKEGNFLNQTVFLIDKNGKVLNTTTNKNGYFAFVKIENTNYSLIIKPNTIPKLQLEPMLDLTDRCLFIPQSTVQKFKYHKIEKNTSDKIINFVLQGKIKSNIQTQAINDISMLLIDSDGNIVDKTNTNNTGHFTFHKLQLGDYYVVFETQNSNLKAEIVYANDNSSIPNDVATKYFLNEKVYFDYKSVSLDDSAKINLTLVLKKLIESPLQKINIYTYADPFGSNTYNLKLTAQRAQTIKNYFIRYGISKNNIKIIPRGEFKPLFISADKHANRLNRRAEFEIIQY
jgi:outer membrane protein OmpA-like peptidoglycan-associated protein